MGKSRSRHHLQINEIFKSIQGEGRAQGELTTFVRTTGCNLRCSWCDTAYAYVEGNDLSIDKILAQVERLDCSNICLTGGEPLLQAHLQNLIDALNAAGCFMAVETNGTMDISRFSGVGRFVVDYKLPAARARADFYVPNFGALRKVDELKFVVSDRADYEAAKEIVKNNEIAAAKLMSPCWEAGVVCDLADWIIEDKLVARYSLPIHKVIWGAEGRSR